jgi:hypothetical protein
MKEGRTTLRVAGPILSTLAFLGLGLAGCEASPVQPVSADALASIGSVANMGGSHAESVALEAFMPGVSGTSTLYRRGDGFTVRISASGLSPRHPVTVWAIDVESGAVGRVTGGVVGGGGSVNLAGNQCVHPGGKTSGSAPVCDLIDPAGSIRFALLVGEDEWTPGDQVSRRVPAGKPLAAMAHHLIAP